MNRLSLRNNRWEFKDFRKITDGFRGVYRIDPNSRKKKRGEEPTRNRLHLETLGYEGPFTVEVLLLGV
jgi:hypothetical protein